MAKRPTAREIEFEITNMIDDIIAEDREDGGGHKIVMVDGKIEIPMNDPSNAAQIKVLQKIRKFVKGE